MSCLDFHVKILPEFFQPSQADDFLESLQKLTYTTIPRARSLKPKRSFAAFGDEGIAYTYNGISYPAESWPEALLQIRDAVEKETGFSYNYVLIHYLLDGSQFLPQHRDKESVTEKTFPVVGIHFGETRRMLFKKTGGLVETIELSHGSALVLNPPTNEVYTYGIPADCSIKGPHINLQFRHVLMPVKKLRLQPFEDNFPTDALMSEDMNLHPSDQAPTPASSPVIQPAFVPTVELTPEPSRTSNSVPVMKQWNLTDFKKLDILHTKHYLRIRLCEYTEQGNPTKNCIYMMNSTWSVLSEKLSSMNREEGMLCNKQLIICPVENGFLFQQMFDSKVSGFYLKPSFFKLTHDQIFELIDYIPEINQYLINVQITQLLPSLIMSKTCTSPQHFESENEASQYLLSCIENEIHFWLNSLYPCAGCLFNDACQSNHDCLMTPFHQKYSLFREKVLMNLNLYRIVRHLQEKCLCHFKNSFFKSFELATVENSF